MLTTPSCWTFMRAAKRAQRPLSSRHCYMLALMLSHLLSCLLSRTHAVAFHYDVYSEISPTRTLSKTLHYSVSFCRFKLIIIRENTYCIIGYGDLDQHSSSHQAHASGLGLDVMTCAKMSHLAFPTMPYAKSHSTDTD